MSFSAIVVSHANERGLRKMLGNLMYQTRPPDETIVLVSGMEPAAIAALREDFSTISVLERPNLNDWGHAKRAEGLALAGSEFVGFFNDDDSYDSTYLEKMLAAVDGYDAAFCAWNTIPHCRFRLCSSTSGNFIVRTSLGQAVGYLSRAYEADGHFINAIAANGAVAPKVNELLYFHNVQP